MFDSRLFRRALKTGPIASPNLNSDKIKAILSEYSALRLEIIEQIKFKYILLQFHAALLAAITGTIITQDIGAWILFLIPFECSIFRAMTSEAGVAIKHLGNHIRNSTEKRIREILKDGSLMWWQQYVIFRRQYTAKSRRPWSLTFEEMPYVYPPAIALLISFLLIASSVLNYACSSMPILVPLSVCEFFDQSGLRAVAPLPYSPFWLVAVIPWIVGLVLTVYQIRADRALRSAHASSGELARAEFSRLLKNRALSGLNDG